MTAQDTASGRFTLLFATTLLAASCGKKADTGSAGPAASAPSPTAAAPTSLSDFEGDITVVSKSAKERRPVPPITLTVKGTKLRFDLPEGMEAAPHMGERAYAIADATTKKFDIVVDEKKMVMEMDLANMGEQLKKLHPQQNTEPDTKGKPTLTKSGHTETVAGIQCEDWQFTSAKGDHGSACVASQSAPWLPTSTLGLFSDEPWAKDLFDGQHLPLRVIGYDAAGTEDTRIEVTKIERKSVLDSTFAVPPEYRTMDFTRMMAGMEGLMGVMTGGAHPSGGMSASPSALPPGGALPKNAAEMLKQLGERAKPAGARAQPGR